jgi:hypothetical protein
VIIRLGGWKRTVALTLWLAVGAAAGARAQVTRDSAAGYAPADSTRQADAAARGEALRAVTQVAPADTVLAKACSGLPAGAEAPGLLAVVFRPGTSEAERVAAARAVGGALAGASEYGEDYVRVPTDARPLTVIADRLIRQVPVTTVSAAPCPAPPQVPGAAGGTAGTALPTGATKDSSVRDSTRRDSTARNSTTRDSTRRDSTVRSP